MWSVYLRIVFLYLILILTAAKLNAQAVSNFMRPTDVGVESYDDFKNRAFNCYEFSYNIKNITLISKKLATSDIVKIQQTKLEIDSLLMLSDYWFMNMQKSNELKSIKGAWQNTQLATDVLKRAKVNLRITLAVVQEFDDNDE